MQKDLKSNWPVGEKAQRILKDRDVDFILKDVRMPDMNGVELYLETNHPYLISILTSEYAADDIVPQGMKKEVMMVLTNPLDIDFFLMLFSSSQL